MARRRGRDRALARDHAGLVVRFEGIILRTERALAALDIADAAE